MGAGWQRETVRRVQFSIVPKAPRLTYRAPFVTRKPPGAFVRRLLLALVPLFVAVDAGAQVIRRGFSTEPSAIFSLGVARQGAFSLRDGATNSTWRFGDATQYTGSFERALGPGLSFGLSGNTSRVPVTVASAVAGQSGDADVVMSQAFATLYATSGRTFHTVLEGDIGATIYSSFTPRAGSAALVPPGTDADFAFAVGYGFGYSFSNRFSIDFVQTLGNSYHQKTGLNAGDDSSVRINSSRLVARFGLGQR
jgi:hypothetical protein